jgi:hypothetical protein
MKENISIHNILVKSINEDFITNHTNVHTSLSDKILSLEKENKNFKKKRHSNSQNQKPSKT